MGEPEKTVTVTAVMTDSQALALAQFCKRCGWTEWRSNAVDDAEARNMRSAFCHLQEALAQQGYAPR